MIGNWNRFPWILLGVAGLLGICVMLPGNTIAWITLGVTEVLGLILSAAVLRRRSKAGEASRPYRCLTFYLQREEMAEWMRELGV